MLVEIIYCRSKKYTHLKIFRAKSIELHNGSCLDLARFHEWLLGLFIVVDNEVLILSLLKGEGLSTKK